MTSGSTIHLRAGYRRIAILLFTFVLSLLTATPARAEDSCATGFDKTVARSHERCKPRHAPGGKLTYSLHFLARLSEINHVRNPLIAHAVIGRQEQHCCSKEHTR
jgi:hypothetical protein